MYIDMTQSTTEHLIFLSVPGLRPRDIDAKNTPMLYAWANRGTLVELTPTFPCVTSCVQATMLTGTPPAEHGVIANGFYHRDRREVEFWVGHNDVIAGEQIWDAIRSRRPQLTSAAWHAQNIKGAAADFIVTPAPIHEPDGSTKLWCYSKPEGLYQQLLGDLGHFPLQHYWGPLSNIESTRWILRAAAWLIDRHAPNFHWIYIPHLDYASQKFGPNSPQAIAALGELDRELAVFAGWVGASQIGKDAVFLVAGEYAMTDVTGVVYPNRILRDAGWLAVREEQGTEFVDFAATRAFAMVDHQFAHVYLNDAHRSRERKRPENAGCHGPGTSTPEGKSKNGNRQSTIAGTADLFRNVPGIAGIYGGADRSAIGMSHERAGDVVLVCDDAHWMAYYWWLNDAAAPTFARTVDIHRKPGYDPVELFFDPATRGIPLDATLVKGSHGVPATGPQHRTALICSTPTALDQSSRTCSDVDMNAICQRLLGI